MLTYIYEIYQPMTASHMVIPSETGNSKTGLILPHRKILMLKTITDSAINNPCFTWHPYEKQRLFNPEVVSKYVFWNVCPLKVVAFS